YTTPVGLVGIVQSQRLWASNVEFLNDASEPGYALDVIERSFNAVKRAFNMSSGVTDTLEQLWDWMTSQRELEGPHLYAFGFCEVGDLLSQWRGYGVLGRGYAAGFGGRRIRNLLQPEEGQYLVKVVYEANRQKKEADTIIGEILEFVASIEAKFGPLGGSKYTDAPQLYLGKLRTALLSEVIRLCAKFKAPAFSEEHEWRILQFLHPRTQSPKVNFRATATSIIPYIELKLGFASNRLPIELVTIGPTLRLELSRDVVRLLFEKSGYDAIRAVDSAVPFRE